MIDIQLLRDNPDLFKQKSAEKKVDVDIDKIIELDVQYRALLGEVEKLRSDKNAISAKMKNGRPEQALIDEAKQIKVELADREELLKKSKAELDQLVKAVPNAAMDHVPVGETEDDNVVLREIGEKPQFAFKPKTHWEIAKQHDLFDKERAAKIAGSRFVYLKGGLVRLQFAVVQFVMDELGDESVIQSIIDANDLKVSSKPFNPVLPPAMLRTEPYKASARLNAEETTYKLEGDDLWLNASAEHTLCTMYWNEQLKAEDLPIRYIGYLTSFRREAGTYGKDTEGIIRLHQFDKLEMESFTSAETGFDEHKLMYGVQEHLMQRLGLHYKFIQKCSVDIGKPNASGIDIDCWYPGQERYIETHTADYMTDYQTRDLNIKTKDKEGKLGLAHTNDATAFALSRILAAIVENFQNEDGSVNVPEVLQKYMGDRKTI